MKKNIYKSIKMLTLLFAVLFTTNSCSDILNSPLKDKNTGEDLHLLLLDLDFFETKFIIEFVNHNTNEIIDGEDLLAYIGSDDASRIVNLFGEYKEEHIVESGYLELYLDPGYEISAQKPIEFQIAAYSDRYLSLPTTVEFTEKGTKNITVRMLDLEEGEVGLSAFANNNTFLKSTLIDAPFTVNYTDTESIIKVLTANYSDKDIDYHKLYRNSHAIDNVNWQRVYLCNLTNIFFNFCPIDISNANAIHVDLNATGSVDAKVYKNWGLGSDFNKSITLSSTESVFSTSKRTGIEKCSTGIRIKIDKSEDKEGSGSFHYVIKFSDNSTKEGNISGNFENLSKGVLIEPIYYPSGNTNTEVTITGNAQYTVSGKVSLTTPCKGVANFTATKIPELIKYNYALTYGCDGSPVAVAYSGMGRYKIAGSEKSFEKFSMNAGGFSVQLYDGRDYKFEVLFDDVWYPFTMNTSPSNIVSTLNGQTGDKYKIQGASYKSTTNGYLIKVPVTFTDEDLCDKLTGGL